MNVATREKRKRHDPGFSSEDGEESPKRMPVVSTIKEKCRRCYTCVRKCPAKAIKVEEGQAKVVEERCIACGSCIKVCHQEAKADPRFPRRGKGALLEDHEEVIACLAPSFPGRLSRRPAPARSFPASRPRVSPKSSSRLRGGSGGQGPRPLGKENVEKMYISSPCPALGPVHQEILSSLVASLAPLFRRWWPWAGCQTGLPAGGQGGLHRPLHRQESGDRRPGGGGDVDAVLTFVELDAMFQEAGLILEKLPESGPRRAPAPAGTDLSRPGGLLRSAAMKEDICRTGFW